MTAQVAPNSNFASATPPMDSDQTDSPPPTTSKAECALAVSQTVLGVLKNVGQLSTVPLLQEAASLACTVLQMVQDMKSNKEAYKGITEEVCALLLCISIEPGDMSDDLKADLENLVKDLESIQKLCLRLKGRNRVVRFFLSQKDAGDINGIRLRIESTFRIFFLKSTISIRAIQKSWSGKDTPKATQDLIAELKAQREMMEQTGKTFAAFQIPAYPQGNETRPARAMQEFVGDHVFEGQVETTNDHRGGNDVVFYSPMQAFTGNQVFKGKVTTVNRII